MRTPILSQRKRGGGPQQIPVRRLGKPEELGALVTFLASEQAGYITGQSLVIDGGWMRGF